MSYIENVKQSGQVRESTLVDAVTNLEPLKERIANAAKRIGQCADMIGGSRPRDAAGGPANPTPSPALTAQLHRHRADFNLLLDALETEIGRLEISISG